VLLLLVLVLVVVLRGRATTGRPTALLLLAQHSMIRVVFIGLRSATRWKTFTNKENQQH
jgi:hypothetical protein